MNKKLILFSLILVSSLVSCGTVISSGGPLQQGGITDQEKNPTNNGELEWTDMANGDFNEDRYYRNDLKKLPLPDPYVLTVEENGEEVYYIYGTTDRTGSKTLDCYRTTNFNSFDLYMNIDKQNENSWSNCADRSRFAPEVYKFDDTYYLYYSDIHKDNGRRYISVMTSSSPTGPFVEYNNGQDAVFKFNDDLGLSVLDQHVFQDDDGQLYMYYSVYDTKVMQYICGVKLKNPFETEGEHKVLIRPGQLKPTDPIGYDSSKVLSWECYIDFEVAEGPFMIKSPENGLYYLTYSVNHYPNKYYSVCYAYSSSPLGDYTKPYEKNQVWTNLLFGYAGTMQGTVYDQWDGFMSGTAHHCFFKIGDQYMIGYHAHGNRKGGQGAARFFGMDYLFFDNDGVPFTRGPSYSIQPLPEKISGYRNLIEDSTIYYENIKNPDYLFDNFVVEHYNLAQENDREATLLTGKSYLKFKFDKKYTISGIFIYNSAFYDKALTSDIPFISLQNGYTMENCSLNYNYINDETEFVFPASGYHFDINDEQTDCIVIGFDCDKEYNLNEIVILGCEA